MHNDIITAMLKALKPTLKNPTKARLILERYWQDKIAIIWRSSDVNRCANELDLALTKTEAIKILKDLHYHHNAQYGLKWEDLTDYIEEHVLGRKLTKREIKRFVEKNIVTIHRE
jgi:hypothetical protein